jgi:hypothetical protein
MDNDLLFFSFFLVVTAYDFFVEKVLFFSLSIYMYLQMILTVLQ